MVPRQPGNSHQRTASQSINRYIAPVLLMWTTTFAIQPRFLLYHFCTNLVSVQVFFCSRTHSQLSQFVSELQRTTFADTIASVSLASRKVSSVPVHCQALSKACQSSNLECILHQLTVVVPCTCNLKMHPVAFASILSRVGPCTQQCNSA